MGFLGILGLPLGYVLQWIYELVGNYGWAIILFTVAVRLAFFPLQIKQQKSTARMAAYQPMIAEIQKKYAKDREKQNEELMRMQQEYGYNPAAGCLPMFLNLFVIFGIIEVVYRPLQYILHLPSEVINQAAQVMGLAASNYTTQSQIVQQVQRDASMFADVFSADQLAAIQDFHVNFMGINLMDKPGMALNALLVFPLLSIVTMAMLNVITMKMSGQQMQGSMKLMPWMTSLMFVWFAFQVPVGFSLYYTVSNLFQFVQSVILRRMCDAEALKAQIQEEIEQKKREKKQKKEVTVEENGKKTVKKVNEAELNRLRLDMARKLDEEKYKDERTVPLSQLSKEE